MEMRIPGLLVHIAAEPTCCTTVAVPGPVPADTALQQLPSLGAVAAALVLSYTRPEVQDESANAPPPLVISPHVATKGAALQQLASFGFVAAALVLSYTRPEVQDESANAPPPLVISPHVATKPVGHSEPQGCASVIFDQPCTVQWSNIGLLVQAAIFVVVSMLVACVTSLKSHLIRLRSNSTALLNIRATFTIFATFHSVMSWLNDAAPSNIVCASSPAVTTHLEMSPLKVAAFGLPPVSDPPCWLRLTEKAAPKSVTLLTSHSSIMPYSRSAAGGELTTLHEAAVRVGVLPASFVSINW